MRMPALDLEEPWGPAADVGLEGIVGRHALVARAAATQTAMRSKREGDDMTPVPWLYQSGSDITPQKRGTRVHT
jgi:hypothetical protein